MVQSFESRLNVMYRGVRRLPFTYTTLEKGFRFFGIHSHAILRTGVEHHISQSVNTQHCLWSPEPCHRPLHHSTSVCVCSFRGGTKAFEYRVTKIVYHYIQVLRFPFFHL